MLPFRPDHFINVVDALSQFVTDAIHHICIIQPSLYMYSQVYIQLSAQSDYLMIMPVRCHIAGRFALVERHVIVLFVIG